MANIWFISDTHFTHENIIGYCGRPFANATEMDEVMVANWNAHVRPQDHIYHLGDVAMDKKAVEAIMPRLQGHKRLVRGNHDIFRTKIYAKYFDEIYGIRVLDNLLFTHMPVHPLSLGRFRANVHGHIHEKDYLFPYINISVEKTAYRPVSLDEINHMVKEGANVS